MKLNLVRTRVRLLIVFLVLLLILVDVVFDLIPSIQAGASFINLNGEILEFFTELVITLLSGVIALLITSQLLRRLRYLEGLHHICAVCKRVHMDDDSWVQLEAFVHDNSEADFSHGYCPDCAVKFHEEV